MVDDESLNDYNSSYDGNIGVFHDLISVLGWRSLL